VAIAEENAKAHEEMKMTMQEERKQSLEGMQKLTAEVIESGVNFFL
jgi:hypothetical protein